MRTLVSVLAAAALAGCAVVDVVGATARVVATGVEVTGSVVGATVDVAGAAVGGAIDLATGSGDGPEGEAERRAAPPGDPPDAVAPQSAAGTAPAP